MTFSLESESGMYHVIKHVYFMSHKLCVVEAFMTLNCAATYQYK